MRKVIKDYLNQKLDKDNKIYFRNLFLKYHNVDGRQAISKELPKLLKDLPSFLMAEQNQLGLFIVIKITIKSLTE